MYLAEIFPGVEIQSIKNEIPWDLQVAPNLSVTQRPTDEEISFIRNFAPEMSAGRELTSELRAARIREKARQRARSNV